MRSVERVNLKEMPERPHRLGSFRTRGLRRRYVPHWEGGRAGQPTAYAVRRAGRAESWIALSVVSHETTIKKVGELASDSEISRLACRELVAQCSILVVIAGIVAGLIAA